MIQNEEDDDDIDPYMRLRANEGDKLHDLQLLRDLSIINAHTVSELGSLPAGGLLIVPKRKPYLPGSISTASPSVGGDHQENETMDYRSMAVMAGIALSGCVPVSDSSRDELRSNAEDLRKDSLMQTHKFRLNPNPRRRYDIIMTIKDAPGPFGVVGLSAKYYADCWYVVDKFAGALAQPRYSISPEIRKLDEVTYVSTVYLDPLIDEDYYGNGICRWRLNAVSVGLMATGSDGETRFSGHISLEKMIDKEPVVTYFWKERYPREEGYGNFLDSGDSTLDAVPVDKRREFFAVTLNSQEVQP